MSVCESCGTLPCDSARSDRCADCRVMDRPSYIRCPYRYCLAPYVHDPRRPHRCAGTPSRPDPLADARLALINQGVLT